MIPLRVDYSPVDRPTHLATHFTSYHGEKRIIFDEYFGGVTLFPIMDYYKVNGYSNNYWGWGYEDDEFPFRISKLGYVVGRITGFKKPCWHYVASRERRKPSQK